MIIRCALAGRVPAILHLSVEPREKERSPLPYSSFRPCRMFSLWITVNGHANESFGSSAKKWRDTESSFSLSLSLSLTVSWDASNARHRFRREDRRVNIHDSVRKAKCRVLSMHTSVAYVRYSISGINKHCKRPVPRRSRSGRAQSPRARAFAYHGAPRIETL